MKVFDAHSDILTDIVTHRLDGMTDVFNKRHRERLTKGGVEGSILVMWVDPHYNHIPVERMDLVMREVKKELDETDGITVVRTYDEAIAARDAGKFYAFLGIEGLIGAGDQIDRIDLFYDFGVRHASLTWNEENLLATGAPIAHGHGVTDLGRQVIHKMQTKGMILDVSHLNKQSFWGVIDVTEAPIIASHSNCKFYHDVPRNLSDDQLRAVRDTGGVVGLNSYGPFVSPDPELMNVKQLALHAAHMVDVMGIECVGCGFDFVDYFDKETSANWSDPDDKEGADGISSASMAGNILDELRALGMNESEIEKIAYGNFLDVIRRTVK